MIHDRMVERIEKRDDDMNEEMKWEKLLNIHTTGRDATNANPYYYAYEPTPYEVLERLAKSGYIDSKSVLLDYGCGKGRVEFMLAYLTKARCIGIEYDNRIYQKALENKQQSPVSGRVGFVEANAKFFPVPTEVNSCYFFNPFSVELLRNVMTRIKESFYMSPRRIQLFFYYPSDEYIAYLMSVEEIEFLDEIDCRDLCKGTDAREKIMIFEFK